MLSLAVLAAVSLNPVRIYWIGNSVTDTLDYQAFEKSARTAGNPIVWGRHMIPGSPLGWLWDHQDSGFSEPPFGAGRQALANYAWDAVSLQPFDRPIEGEGNDLDLVKRYATLAIAANPKVRILIYQRWPRLSKDGKGVSFDVNSYGPTQAGLTKDLATFDPYEKRYLVPFTGGWDLGNESRDFFSKLRAAAQAKFPAHAKQFELVPVGDAFLYLDRELRAGKVPGWTTVYQLYQDGIHLTTIGRYFVGSVFYATIFGKHPKEFSNTSYTAIDPSLLEAMHRSAWQAIQTRHGELSRGT